jgi:hypothetical protein
MAKHVNVPSIHPNDRQLNLFISHKMPADSVLATRIAEKLTRKFGAGRIVVRLAEQYPYGDRWRTHIQDDINKSDMFIYLHTGEYDDWLFCLFECGMFVNRAGHDAASLGITTFCKTLDNLPAPLREFNALLMSTESILKLFHQIYTDPPWAINPQLGDNDFAQDASYIVDEFHKSYYVVHNFAVTPSIIIELDKGSPTLQSLAAGTLPDNSLVTGGPGWQVLFGKDIDTGDRAWKRLRSSWQYSQTYEWLLAKIIERALNNSSTRALLLRSPVTPSLSTPSLYRVALRRYEELSNARYRFYFTAALIDLPFNIPTERAERREVTLYHLINLCWYFRRQFVDGLYNRLLEQIAIPSKGRMENITTELCDEIAYELMDIDAQALSRGVDNPLTVHQALGTDDPHVVEMMEHGKRWYELRPHILEMTRKRETTEDIAKAVYDVTEMNYEFYVEAAEAFNRYAKLLTKPPSI